jgi:methyltransferase (TIGR00027 family)
MTFETSRTAQATALMRALHSREDERPLIDDAWGERLVPSSLRHELVSAALSHLAAAEREQARENPGPLVDAFLRRSPAFANVILRTRYTEDALRRAVQSGVRQYVLIGAGFDSFALRRPEFARDLRIFEIDHPATQNLKLERLSQCGVELPKATAFIGADLSRESVAQALSRSDYDATVATFFSWLGVSMYLPHESNLATLRSVGSCAPGGSWLVFTYLKRSSLNSTSAPMRELTQRVAALGEPFLSGFDPATLPAELAACGLSVREDLSGDELIDRYGKRGAEGFNRHSSSHIALAQLTSVV